MTDLTTRSVPDRQEPDRAPAGPGAAVPAGVPLSRLLAMARLTAAQALEIGAGVLAAAADGEVGDPLVTADGRVVVGQSPGRRPVDGVLADVAAAVSLPVPPAGRDGDRRMVDAHVDADLAVQDLSSPDDPTAARRLQDAAAAIDRPAVRAELAALVRAAGGPRTGSPTAVPHREPVRHTRPASRSRGRRVAAWLLSMLVLAAVVVAEIVFLRDDITADIGLLLEAGRGGTTATPAPTTDRPPLAAPAPAAAGSVAAVDLRPLDRCAPSAPCTVRLSVRLLPAPQAQVVTWSYRVADRCTGTAVDAPGGTLTVPALADRATAVGVVPLPASEGAAVVAVTTTPAAAASPSLEVGSCPPGGRNG